MITSETSTTRTQRIAIWGVAILMIIGTIGSFAMIVLANENDQRDQTRIKELEAEYQVAYSGYQAKLDAQAAELSKKYYPILEPYSSRVGVFNKGSVTELETTDLVVGDGEGITSDSSFSVYYIGWNPEGVVFDQSIKDGSLIAPFLVTPGSVIEGWTEGVDGMKVGGIRELSIPADMAYGDTGSGEDILPNTPLKFIVMIIPTPEEIAMPEIPSELLQYYQAGGA